MAAPPRRNPRGLTMQSGRRIPRSEPAKPKASGVTETAVPPPGLRAAFEKAGAELADLAEQVRACRTGRCDGSAVLGSGPPRAAVLLLKEHPSEADIASGAAFTSEAEALGKAFDRLQIPMSWVYGTCAVRCGAAPASPDEVRACSGHLLVELEAIGPRVVVAFGPRALDAVTALDGRCGIAVPDEIDKGQPVTLRPGLHLVATEPLPQGVTVADAKRRLWSDLQTLPRVLGPA